MTVLRLADRVEKHRRTDILMRVVSTAHLGFALQVVVYAQAVDRPSFILHAVKHAFVTRVVDEFESGRGDVFGLFEAEWPDVLAAWDEPDEAGAYVAQLLARQPKYWATLADFTLQRGVDASWLRIASLKQVLELRYLAGVSKTVNPESIAPDERELVMLFIDELQLVPSLCAEVSAIAKVATTVHEIAEKSGASQVSVDTSVWQRARPRLEPALAPNAWWSSIVRFFDACSELVVLGELLQKSEPTTDTKAELTQLLQLAGEVTSNAPEVIGRLEHVVGLQKPLRLA